MVDVPRVRLGVQSNGVYGLRISEPGYDVTTNPVNDERLIFNSDWESSLPLYQRLTGTILGNSTIQSFPFASNLGFVPWVNIIEVVAGVHQPMPNTENRFLVVVKDRLLGSTLTGSASIVFIANIYNLQAMAA